MHDQPDQIALRVGDDVALAALDLLSCVIAPRAAALGGFHRLAVNHSCRRARLSAILAAADGLRPSTSGDGANRQALLSMRETDIGNELWKIEVDYRTGPILLVNNRVSGLAAQIRSVPLLQGLILPHAFRAVLQNLIQAEKVTKTICGAIIGGAF